MITSMAGGQMKELSSLLQKSKARREKDCFVVEGIRMCMEAPKDRVVRFYVSESFLKNAKNVEKMKQYSFEIVSDSVFKKVADTQAPQGIMGIIRQKHTSLLELLEKDQNPLFLILENLQDPGNLGTILRTAEGAGVTGIIMSKNCVDIYNPKTVRSTMGSLYRMPFCIEENLLEVIKYLQEKQVQVLAAHLDGKKFHDALSYENATAFLIGNEGNGLSKEVSEAADEYLRIPMEGQVESLNAAVSAAILMYEANRQRRNSRR